MSVNPNLRQMEESPSWSATVAEWNDHEGWGVLVTDGVPDGIWTHFSAIDAEGFRALIPGSDVEVIVEGPLPFDQDGFRYRAKRVFLMA